MHYERSSNKKQAKHNAAHKLLDFLNKNYVFSNQNGLGSSPKKLKIGKYYINGLGLARNAIREVTWFIHVKDPREIKTCDLIKILYIYRYPLLNIKYDCIHMNFSQITFR